MSAPWRVAKALLALRRQVDALAPNRSRANDGTIGDASHADRKSDHNPWVIDALGNGVVTAMDITDDPRPLKDGGFDAAGLAEALRTARDQRLKYVIWNRMIFSSAVRPWEWRHYSLADKMPHDHHVHISVMPEPRLYDDGSEWALARPRPEGT